MKARQILFIIGLALLTIVILYLVTVWLPQHSVRPAVFVLRNRLAPPLGAPAPRILIPPTARLAQPGFWLSPFGLGREGLPGVWWYAGSPASVLILAVIALSAMPRRVGVLARVMSSGCGQQLWAFVIGLLGYLTIALLVFLLFVNVVGGPLLLVLGIGAYLATAVGLVAVSLTLGTAVCRFARLGGVGPLFRLCVGVVLLFLGSIIPYLGWLVFGVSAITGFGAVLWTRGGEVSGWSLAEVDEQA